MAAPAVPAWEPTAPRNPYLDEEFRKQRGVVYRHEDGTELSNEEVAEYWRQFKALARECRAEMKKSSFGITVALHQDVTDRVWIRLTADAEEAANKLETDWVARFEALPIAKPVVEVVVGSTSIVIQYKLVDAAEFHALGGAEREQEVQKSEEASSWWTRCWPFKRT